jgi:ribosomal protein S18 acetylase RimI-like enzyme
VIRDDAGRTVGVTAGYTWAGVSEIKQIWVDEAYRGRAYGRALLDAMIVEARRRGAAHLDGQLCLPGARDV